MEEEDEEDMLYTNNSTGRQTQTREPTKITFVWASPLHRMKDPVKNGPYEIVELSSLTKENTWMNYQVKTEDTEEHNNQYGLESTFAKFGYEGISDIDTSDDDQMEPVDLSNTFHQMDIPSPKEGNVWSFAKLKGSQNKVVCNEVVDYSNLTVATKLSDSYTEGCMNNKCGGQIDIKGLKDIIDVQKERDKTDGIKHIDINGGNVAPREEMFNLRTGEIINVEHEDQIKKEFKNLEVVKDVHYDKCIKSGEDRDEEKNVEHEEDVIDVKDGGRVDVTELDTVVDGKDGEKMTDKSIKFKIVNTEDRKVGVDVKGAEEGTEMLDANGEEDSKDGVVKMDVNYVEENMGENNAEMVVDDKAVLEKIRIEMNEQTKGVLNEETIVNKTDGGMMVDVNVDEEEVHNSAEDVKQILRTDEREEVEYLRDTEHKIYIKGQNEPKDVEFGNFVADDDKQRDDNDGKTVIRKKAVKDNYTTSTHHKESMVCEKNMSSPANLSLGNEVAGFNPYQKDSQTQPKNATTEITGGNCYDLTSRNNGEDNSSPKLTNTFEYDEHVSCTRDSVLTTCNSEKGYKQKSPEDQPFYRNVSTLEQNQSKRPKSCFYSNIKTPSRSEQEAHKGLYGGTKPKIPVVKKEYDNSFQLLNDLCSIGSTNPDSNITVDRMGDNFHLIETAATDRNNMALDFKEPQTSMKNPYTTTSHHMEEFPTHPTIMNDGSRQSRNDTAEEQNVKSFMNDHVYDDFVIRHFEHKDNNYVENMHETEVKEDKRDRKDECSDSFKSKELDSSRPKRRDDSMQTNSLGYTRKSIHDDGWYSQSDNRGYPMETSFEEQANQPWKPGHFESFSNEYESQLRSPVDNNILRPEFDRYHHQKLSKNDRQSPIRDENPGSSNLLNCQQQPSSGSLQRKPYSSVPSHTSPSKPEHNSPLSITSRRRDRKSWYDSTYTTEGHYSMQEYLDTLTEYMEHIGFDVKNVSGDGNCLFAAVVDQLRINGDFTYSTESLRTKSVQYLRARPHVEDETHLEEFLTNETWAEYLERMELDGEWGDDIILRGISELTGRKIVVYSSYMSRTELTPTNVYQEEVLYIGHIKSLMHFVSLRPKMWEVVWPMRALIRRNRRTMEEIQLAMTTGVSCKEEVINKMSKIEDAIKTRALNDCYTNLGELGELLDIAKSSLGEDFPSNQDTAVSLDTLLREKFKFDKISGIPMAHLSFLIKTLIKPKHFRTEDQDLKSVFDFAKDGLVRIGCEALEIMADLIDYSSILQQYMSLTEKQPKKEPKRLSVTLVSKLTNKTYRVNDKIQENSPFRPVKDVLLIDDSETYPGYTRLRPTNTSYWAGCVEWVSCQDAFLWDLHVKKPDDQFIRNFSFLNVRNFKGLDCKLWPRQASNWTKKRPISGWPSQEKIQEASEKGCLLIRRAHAFSEQPDIEWRFVFNEAEDILAKSFSDAMVYCFRVFHALVNRHAKHFTVQLKSYWILTAMFHCSEIIPPNCWSSNPGGCILYLVSWLSRQFREKFVPNYFIPENNMIEELEDGEINTLEYNLQALRCFPIASIYFLIESHCFLQMPIIDQIESSIEDYRKLKEKHEVVERTFVPLCFSLATQKMKYKVLPFYYDALEYIEEAFEEMVSVQEGGHNITFVDVVLTFLSGVRNDDVKLTFVQLVDKVKKTHLSQLMLKHTESQTVSDILGRQYSGAWANVYVDVSEDKWNSVYKLTGDLFLGREFEDCAEILRCSLAVLQKELKEDRVDCSEISDERTRKRFQSSNHKHVYTTLRYLVTFYKHLAICYEHMNQTELFQEHIHDYEEIVGRIDSSVHYQYLAKIYRQLGNREKAEDLEKKMKSTGEKRSSLLVLIKT